MVLLALAVFPLIAISRWYIVRLQDRIIQLEMQVRARGCCRPGRTSCWRSSRPSRSWRCASPSDAELGDLLARAVREQMTPDAIKRAIKQWRPDYLRT